MNDQQINIVTFSIVGVPGFKSVVASGSLPNKRLNSAFNEIHRRLKEHGNSEAFGVAEEVKNVIVNNVHNEITPLVVVNEPTAVVSTAEFLETGKALYDANFDLFISSSETIKQGLEQFRRRSREDRTPLNPEIHEPKLYLCTGSLFGNEPFPLVLRAENFQEGETAQQGVVSYCRDALRNIKSWRLTDYLRVTKSDKLDDIKQDILTLDRHIANVDSIVVVELGSLVKYQPPGTSQVRRGGHARFTQTAATLEMESEYRLQTYIADNCFVRTVV